MDKYVLPTMFQFSTLSTPGIEPTTLNHKLKKMKKNSFFDLVDTGTWTHDHTLWSGRQNDITYILDPIQGCIKMFLAPPAHPLSDVRPQSPFYLWTNTFCPLWFNFRPCRHRESNPRPQTTKSKKNEKINSTLPTPGLEPTTIQFEADAKMT